MSDPWEFMWAILPPGFRFHPTDEEFINHYLTNYVKGVKDDIKVIPVVHDLFKRDPSELPRLFRGSSIIKSRDPEWWFLSKLRYKGPNYNKFDRSTSKGSWKITGTPNKIHDRRVNRQVGEMRNLVFCEKPRNEQTNWIIHEYYLTDISLGLDLREQRKHVLCHLVNRQYDYTKTSTNMEVDHEFEEQGLGFSEEIIQAKIRSLTEGSPSPTINSTRHNLQERCESLFGMGADSPVNNFEEMEHEMCTFSGENDDIQKLLLDNVIFSKDEENTHSDEFNVESFWKELLELEETSQAWSSCPVLKESRQARPPVTLEEYVIDETREFMDDDFQREEADSTKTPSIKYPMASPNEHSLRYLRRMVAQSDEFRRDDHRRMPVLERRQSTPPGRNHNFKEEKAKGAGIAGTEPRALTQELRRNPSTRPHTLQPRAGNDKMPIIFRKKNLAGGECRPPFDYLVNLGAGIVLLVLMILWLLRY